MPDECNSTKGSEKEYVYESLSSTNNEFQDSCDKLRIK